ncbi:MAG: TIGR00282 family metallophosphoesterase, partial [Fimbriimonas ginsengisoli]|nr:TIGR00282 family metallophosphoesterase [Fimbriimonas ginsengisoli]
MGGYRILFIGDIVGKPGRQILREGLPSLRQTHDPLFVIANGENAAGGVGITPDIAEEILSQGVDAITLGNHAFHKREIYPYLDSGRPIVRPSNMPPGVPGSGLVTIERSGIRLAVMNLCGRVFLDTYHDPFRAIDRLIAGLDTPHRFVDFHAEASSEKQAFAFYVDGRVSAVVGTHTHVQTADERLLEGGTATITDAGMTGPVPSVIGMDRDIILKRFLTGMPHRFDVAVQPGVICGVVVEIDEDSGLALGIERFQF